MNCYPKWIEYEIQKIEEIKDQFAKAETGHELSFLKLLSSGVLRNIQGYSIAIEVDSIDFGIELSDAILKEFEQIVEVVKNLILSKLEEMQIA